MSQAKANASEVKQQPRTPRQPEQTPGQRGGQVVGQSVGPQAALRRARVNPAALGAADLLALQRVVGNRRVQGLVTQGHQGVTNQQPNNGQFSSPGIHSTVSAIYPTRTTILRNSATQVSNNPNKPIFEEFKGANVNKIGHVSAPANQYETAKATGVNLRAKPDGTLPSIAKLVYDTEVQVRALDNTSAFYFVIAKSGAVGWINRDFVVLNPPDLGSRLHHITESNLTTILKNEYVDKNLWKLGTGNDYTTLAAAVVVANRGRKGVYVDWESVSKYKDDNPFKRWLDPWMIDNFAIYHGSKILAGHNIWLPSPSYIHMLQSSGVIGSRPGWINTAVDIGKGIAGFVAGVVSGIFGSIWDTLTGLWELGKSIVSTIRGALDGSLFASIEEIYNQITNMSWEDLKNMVENVITMGQQAFNDFQKKWEHPDTYQQWHFKGYIVGAIALEVVLALFTGGATLGAKVLAKVGKYFPKLMRVLNKLLDLADKLPGRRRKHSKGVKGDKGEPGHRKDRDHDKEMGHDDRAWEQARIMAALVTEEHDLQDTPVRILIPMLNATIAARFKGVSRYKAVGLGRPGTYRIIQMAKESVVDKHYTEEQTTNTTQSTTHAGKTITTEPFQRGFIKFQLTGKASDFNALNSAGAGAQVYIFRNAQGVPIYVGYTERSTIVRLGEHLAKDKPGEFLGEASQIEIRGAGLLEREARALEEDLIQELKPKWNKELTPYYNKYRAKPNPEDVSRAANTLVRLGIKFAD